MTTPASKLVARLANSFSTASLIDIRGIDGQMERSVPYTSAIAEAIRGTVEGVGPSSGRIRYLRRLAPQAMEPTVVAASADSQRAKPAVMPAALATFYEEKCGDAYVGTLCKARGYGFVRWSDRDGFNPRRFNPDRIVPLMAALV